MSALGQKRTSDRARPPVCKARFLLAQSVDEIPGQTLDARSPTQAEGAQATSQADIDVLAALEELQGNATVIERYS